MNQARERIDGCLAQLLGAYGFSELSNDESLAELLDPELAAALLDAAAKVTDEVLEPFDRVADDVGCQLVDGRVQTAPGHKEAWQTYCEGGWLGIEIPEEFGGQGLPGCLAVVSEDIVNQGSVSFGMLPGPTRSATRVLTRFASEDINNEWIPHMVTGEWTASICISEPGAGSDVGRIRTTAYPQDDGSYRIVGDKCWISFGDHDLAERIGHMLLARVKGAEPGVRGLSLFLVPNLIANDAGGWKENGVVVQRIEEKMGLHGSPTCVLAFEESQGSLIGEPGRGLQQLFHMIINMRLQTGAQGLGLATRAYRAALSYAHERRQGGPADQPPVAIVEHMDVRRLLASMGARVETLRALIYTAAVTADRAALQQHKDAAALLGWLLPIVKNSGAESSYQISSDAVTVFGGAGFTREWPVEQYVRDARVLAIYEGTTGMQSQDLVKRQWLNPKGGYASFVAALEAEQASAEGMAADVLTEALASLSRVSDVLASLESDTKRLNAVTRPAFYLATEVAHAWMAARLSRSDDKELAACGRLALSQAGQKFAALEAEISLDNVTEIDDVLNSF